jgi:hypothetical protein
MKFAALPQKPSEVKSVHRKTNIEIEQLITLPIHQTPIDEVFASRFLSPVLSTEGTSIFIWGENPCVLVPKLFKMCAFQPLAII